MTNILRYLGQIVVLAVAALIVGYFSTSPAYRSLPEGKAMIKLSFAHSGERVEDCRTRTDAEMADQAPNMRRRRDCPRERVPLVIDLTMDGELLHHSILEPTGLSRDLPANVYETFVVSTGAHSLTLRLRDSRRTEGYDYEQQFDIELKPAQNLAIDFEARTGGFLIR